MFTGIIEGLGTLEKVIARGEHHRVTIRAPFDLTKVPIGGSIAVDGVCLTVVSKQGRCFAADLGPETLRATTLSRLRAAARVHLERPLRAGDPIGGHIVAGHVDGVGRIVARRRYQRGRSLGLTIEVARDLSRYLVPKGSIAVDGVSLTVNQVDGTRFGVMLIPHTLTITRLGERQAGDRVNIEADPVTRQVARLVDKLARRRK